MPAVNRTSSRLKKRGVYVPPADAIASSNVAFKLKKKANKFKHIRQNKVDKQAQVKQESGESGDDANDDTTPSAAALPPTSSASSASSSFSQFDSSTLSFLVPSSLSGDRLLGVALWEWLMARRSLTIHALWERFQVEWDRISEVDRPPGTNRPINLHGYLTQLRNANSCAVIKKDIREARETVLKERGEHVEREPDDRIARALLRTAQTCTLLTYYMRAKQIIPLESASNNNKNKRKRHDQPQIESDGAEEMAPSEDEVKVKIEPGLRDGNGDELDASTRSKKQRLNGASGGSNGRRARPSAASLGLAQSSAFAALLDCD